MAAPVTARNRAGCALASAAVLALPAVGLHVAREAQSVRVEALRRAASDELAAEAARPPERRPVLRGAPVEGDVTTALIAALRPLPRETGVVGGIPLHYHVPRPNELRSAYLDGVDALVGTLVQDVAAIRSGLQAETVAIAAIDRSERAGRPVPEWLVAVRQASDAFVIAAHRALDAGDAREAIALGLDLARFQDDVTRSGLSDSVEHGFGDLGGIGPELFLGEAILASDAAGLDRLEAELSKLEDTAPRLDTLVRRERLATTRAVLGWDAPPPQGWVERLGGPGLRRRRHWEPFAARFDALETLAALPPHAMALSPAKGVAMDFGSPLGPRGALALALDRLLVRRAARAAVAAERFRRRTARWPASLEEALGRAPGPLEAAPTDGAALRLRVDGRALVVWGPRFGRRDNGGHVDLFDPVLADERRLDLGIVVRPRQ